MNPKQTPVTPKQYQAIMDRLTRKARKDNMTVEDTLIYLLEEAAKYRIKKGQTNAIEKISR